MTESAEAAKCRTAETAKCRAEVASERRRGAVLRVVEAAKPTKCHAAVAAEQTKCRAVMAAQADGVLYI